MDDNNNHEKEYVEYDAKNKKLKSTDKVVNRILATGIAVGISALSIGLMYLAKKGEVSEEVVGNVIDFFQKDVA